MSSIASNGVGLSNGGVPILDLLLPLVLVMQPEESPGGEASEEGGAEPSSAGVTETDTTSEQTAPGTDATKARRFERREWVIHVAPGYDYIWYQDQAAGTLKIMGGSLRFGGHKSLQKGGFFISGGPIVNYTYLTEVGKNAPPDKLHLITVNADMLIGGGGKRVVGYFHATLGLGALTGTDADANDARFTFFGARAAAGLGLHGYINDKFSLGAIFDFGWAGLGLWMNPMFVFNVHFPLVPRK